MLKNRTFNDKATDWFIMLFTPVVIGWNNNIITLILVLLQSFKNHSINYYGLSAKVLAILHPPPPPSFFVDKIIKKVVEVSKFSEIKS